MSRKIWLAYLDAKDGVTPRINKIEQRTVDASKRMTTAMHRFGGAMIAAFGAHQVLRVVGDLVEMGNRIIGVKNAFKRLDDPNLLNNLRRATKGTIDDLQLMQSATFAEKMRIPMDVLAKGMEFAGLVAIETGEDVNYMMESFVTGTARQSIMILDNLGISSKALREEVALTGDFMTALGNIMDRELAKMRSGIDESILKTKQLNIELENQRQIVAEKLARAWNFALGNMANYFVTGFKHAKAFGEMISDSFGDDAFSFDALEDYVLKFARLEGLNAGVLNSMQQTRDMTIQMLKRSRERVETEKESVQIIGNIKKEISGLKKSLDDVVFGSTKHLEINNEIKTLEASIGIEKKKQLETQTKILKSQIIQFQTAKEYFDFLTEREGTPTRLRGAAYWEKKFGGDKSEVAFAEPDWGGWQSSLSSGESSMQNIVGISFQVQNVLGIAGHTFVADLLSAANVAASIVSIIASIAGIASGGFSFFGLEKGGRVTNLGGRVSFTPIPSFAAGGTYSTPMHSGPVSGGYPVMVHRNETLDVYSAGKTSNLEGKLDAIRIAIMGSGVSNAGIINPTFVFENLIDTQKIIYKGFKKNNVVQR